MNGKVVELMSVDRQVSKTIEGPSVFLKNPDTDQMGHYRRESFIVIALHPNYFHISLGVRKFPDVGQKSPVFFFQATEIKVTKNVAQKNQAAESILFQHSQRGFCTAHFRTQVQVRNNYRVIARLNHNLLIYNWCYRMMNLVSYFGSAQTVMKYLQACNNSATMCG